MSKIVAPDVAFCRELHAGMTGADVVAHKIAVARFAPDLYPWPAKGGFTNFFGDIFERSVGKTQTRLGVHKDKTGVIGQATHEALEKALNKKHDSPAFNANSIKMAHDFCEAYAERTVRQRIVDNAFFYYAHRWEISYSWHRPFDVLPIPHVPHLLDCSGLASLCHILAGAPNPNGVGAPTGQGYTGTLMSHGHRCQIGDLELGDLIFYGHSSGRTAGFNVGDPTHVAVFVGPRKELDGQLGVVSNGRRPMGFYDWNYRPDVNHCSHFDVGPGT